MYVMEIIWSWNAEDFDNYMLWTDDHETWNWKELLKTLCVIWINMLDENVK